MVPTDVDVSEVVAERLTALLESKFRDRDRLKAERSQRFVALGPFSSRKRRRIGIDCDVT